MVPPASAPEGYNSDSELEKIDEIRKSNATKFESQVSLLENTEDPQLSVDQLSILSDSDKEHTVSNKEKAKNENWQPIQNGAASPHNRKHKQAKSSEKKEYLPSLWFHSYCSTTESILIISLYFVYVTCYFV